jgi:hypothetical protein
MRRMLSGKRVLTISGVSGSRRIAFATSSSVVTPVCWIASVKPGSFRTATAVLKYRSSVVLGMCWSPSFELLYSILKFGENQEVTFWMGEVVSAQRRVIARP